MNPRGLARSKLHCEAVCTVSRWLTPCRGLRRADLRWLQEVVGELV
jgi:hypothetical protein